jgi:hypothetical protein
MSSTTCTELVAKLHGSGARVSLDNGRVRISAPKGSLGEELSARKEELGTDAACKWVVAARNLLRLAKLSVAPPKAVVRA